MERNGYKMNIVDDIINFGNYVLDKAKEDKNAD
jgi:hypothetical protein